MLIGICGDSGSGKTTLANAILNTKKNSIHCSVDEIGHDVLLIDDVKCSIKSFFGDNIFDDNNINRKKLGELVFSSKENMQKLTDITWPYMENALDIFIEQNKNSIIILDWILLYKTKYFDMCDVKILLDIPQAIRKKRIIQRDSIDEKYFNLRDSSRIDYDKNKFDFVLSNTENKDIERLVENL